MIRRQGAVALLAFLIVQWGLSTLATAQTTIIPSLSVSERYDSNIFWAPKARLRPDSKPEDFVTTVAPQLNIAYTGSLISGRLFGTGLVTKYVHNPNRDFTGYNAGGQLDLTNAAHQVSQRITSLTVRGTYRSTPATTGFGAGVGGLGAGLGSTSGAVLEAGQVTNRASRQIFTLGVASGYQLTGVTTLATDYLLTKISFGDQSGGINNPLFDTTAHRGMTTLSTRISERDTVGATAIMTHFIQEQSSGGSGQGTFTTITETLNWRRRWTEELTSALLAGATVKLPVGSASPGQSSQMQVRPTVTALLTYRSFSEELLDAGAASPAPFDSLPLLAGTLIPGGLTPPGAYTATMSYRLSLVPSIAFGAGPQQTHVVGVNATAGLTSRLSGLVGTNYSHSTRSAPASTADTFGVTAGARYLMGPVLASLTYNWFLFSREQDLAFSSQSSEYEFSKKMVMLTFSYAFASPAFFRDGISVPSGVGAGSSPSGDGSEILKKE